MADRSVSKTDGGNTVRVRLSPAAQYKILIHNMNSQEELLDLVDLQDTVIDKEKRSIIYAQKLSNFRVINAFLINSKGQLWIPRRTVHKALFPLHLDMSVGGHVASGETYEQAFARETQEELNIRLDHAEHRLLGHLTPHQDNVSAFMKVYEIQSDSTPQFNTNDFIEYYWLSPKEALFKIKNGDKAKGDLPKLIEKFYL